MHAVTPYDNAAPEGRGIVSTRQALDELAQEPAPDSVGPIRPEQPREDVAVANFHLRDLQDVERIEPSGMQLLVVATEMKC